MPTIPMRIECFDISNLGETHTVASMVVFEGGAPRKSDYRRFRVRGDAVAGSAPPTAGNGGGGLLRTGGSLSAYRQLS